MRTDEIALGCMVYVPAAYDQGGRVWRPAVVTAMPRSEGDLVGVRPLDRRTGDRYPVCGLRSRRDVARDCLVVAMPSGTGPE